eukprot:801850-Rhodomonas_salina.1
MVLVYYTCAYRYGICGTELSYGRCAARAAIPLRPAPPQKGPAGLDPAYGSTAAIYGSTAAIYGSIAAIYGSIAAIYDSTTLFMVAPPLFT